MKLLAKQLSLVVLVISMVNAGAAHADKGIIVIGGNADPLRRNAVGDAVKDSATKAGWIVAPSPLTKQESQRLLACNDPTLYPCVPASLATGGIERLFVIKVDAGTTDGGEPQLIIDVTLIGTNPQGLVSEKKHCDHCADDQLKLQSSSLAAGMLQELATRSGRTVLDVKSDPPGARITLDGKMVGLTNARFNIYPGEHQITLEKSGYGSRTRKVTIQDGSTEEVAEQLRSSTQPAVESSTTGSRLPVALFGVGVAAVVGGGVMILVDQDPSPTGNRNYWNTAPWGVAIGVAGLATIGLSYYFWHDAKAHSAPTAALVPGGAVIGWSKSL